MLGGAAYIVVGLGVLAFAGLVASRGSGFIAAMFNDDSEFWMRRGLYSYNWWQAVSRDRQARFLLQMRVVVSSILTLFGLASIAAGVIRLR
jgi:hypothetical protein